MGIGPLKGVRKATRMAQINDVIFSSLFIFIFLIFGHTSSAQRLLRALTTGQLVESYGMPEPNPGQLLAR